MRYNKISATNNKREMGHGRKIKWLITVWTAGSIQLHCHVGHHGPISQLIRRVHCKTWVSGPVIYEYKWESAAHLNLPSTTPLPIALPHAYMSNPLWPRCCVETHTVVVLRKAAHKCVVRYQIYFSISKVHRTVLSSWLRHPTLSEMEVDLKYCLWYCGMYG